MSEQLSVLKSLREQTKRDAEMRVVACRERERSVAGEVASIEDRQAEIVEELRRTAAVELHDHVSRKISTEYRRGLKVEQDQLAETEVEKRADLLAASRASEAAREALREAIAQLEAVERELEAQAEELRKARDKQRELEADDRSVRRWSDRKKEDS